MFDKIRQITYGSTMTYGLLAINVLVFLLAQFLAILPTITSPAVALGATVTNYTFNGELWRLITSNFLHTGILHIGFNMFALVQIGGFIEKFYGSKKLFVIYIISGVCGALGSTVLYPGALSYGASTAIFGMIGVLFGNSMRKNRYSPGLPIDMSAMSKNIVIWVVISLLPGISFWGHLGGVIGGLVLGYLFETENSFKDDGFVEKSVIILYNVMLVLTVVSFIALFVSWFN